MAQDFTTDVNTQIARQLGLIGPNEFAGGGLVQTRLDQNPNKVASYEALRNQYTGQESYKFSPTAGGTPAEAQPVNQVMSNQVNNPTLPSGTTQVPVLQQVQQNELLPNAQQIPQTQSNYTPTQTQAQPVTAQQAQTQQVDPAAATQGFDKTVGQYTASTVSDKTPQMTAAQGTVNEQATVQGQLTDLYKDFENGQTPAWAKGAINTAQDQMAARGLGASSIGAAATAGAIQQQAIQIASQDAATYFQMDLTNLGNQQQAALTNTQLKQQSLLSDQSAENAAKQFNAASQSQVQQFMTSLVTSIQTQNAQMANSMNQFNTAEQNKIALQNSANDLVSQQLYEQQKQAVAEFNATLDFNRNTFNAQRQDVVDQSNVMWRRAINTANTAALNASNQTNTQNAFNMSQQALNNLWQQWRDEASWMFQASESEKDRQFNLAYAANNRQFATDQADDAQTAALYQLAGQFAANLIK